MNGTWIPCEDYLPECHRNVLVTLDNGALFIGYVVLKDGEYQWRTISDEIKINVMAWMYLPTPYGTKTPTWEVKFR